MTSTMTHSATLLLLTSLAHLGLFHTRVKFTSYKIDWDVSVSCESPFLVPRIFFGPPSFSSHMLTTGAECSGGQCGPELSAKQGSEETRWAVPASQPCSPSRLKTCATRLARDIGADDDMLKNVDEFDNALAQWYKKDKVEEGLLQLCYIRAEFFQCLGSNYEACTDPFTLFTQEGISFADAFTVSFLIKMASFDCLGGTAIATANYPCIQKTWKSAPFLQNIEACVSNYKAADKSNLQAWCNDAQAFIECTGRLWLQNDRPNPALAWWQCERFRVGFQIDNYCNQLSCNSMLSAPQLASSRQETLSDEWRQKIIAQGAFTSQSEWSCEDCSELDGWWMGI